MYINFVDFNSAYCGTNQESRQGEEYSVIVPVGTAKEDIYQIVEDGMQIRNRNFVQTVELVK